MHCPAYSSNGKKKLIKLAIFKATTTIFTPLFRRTERLLSVRVLVVATEKFKYSQV
jgi:hypothetical protein